MKIEFRLKIPVKRDCIYVRLNFEGGDSDTKHPKEYLIPNVKFSEWQYLTDEIEEFVAPYRILSTLIDVNDENYAGEMEDEYEFINSTYGSEMFRMYENVPNDPQNDFQDKCYLSSIELIGYDGEGNQYLSFY